jgi:muconolactone delta-isomerase
VAAVLYLVIAEVKGIPPPATAETLRQGLAALERLLELQRQGRVEGAGIFAGRMGMCFRVDAASNLELHQIVAGLPTFMQSEWQAIPLVSLEDDVEMTRAAVAHYEGRSATG